MSHAMPLFGHCVASRLKFSFTLPLWERVDRMSGSSFETGEGSVSADRDPSSALPSARHLLPPQLGSTRVGHPKLSKSDESDFDGRREEQSSFRGDGDQPGNRGMVLVAGGAIFQ